MGMAEVIKPAQLLDKDPAKLSHMITTESLLVLIFTYYILEGLLIFVQSPDIGLIEYFYESFMLSPRSSASKLPQENPEHTIVPTLGRLLYLLTGFLMNCCL